LQNWEKLLFSFVISVCLSICMEPLGSHWTIFTKFDIWVFFFKSVEKIQVSLKFDKNNRYCTLHVDDYTFFKSYLTQFFLQLEWGMLQTRVVEKIKTYILSSITFFFFKSCCSWDNVEEYYRTRQVSDDNMAHAPCILIRKATNSKFVIGTAIPQLHTLPVLFNTSFASSMQNNTWRSICKLSVTAVSF
jgi:hypothetical protein